MAQLRFKVKVDEATIKVDTEWYKEAWQEHQEENGSIQEGEDAGEPPAEWVLERVREEINDGNYKDDLSSIFESENVEVTAA